LALRASEDAAQAIALQVNLGDLLQLDGEASLKVRKT
jgi:hypothetical protein